MSILRRQNSGSGSRLRLRETYLRDVEVYYNVAREDVVEYIRQREIDPPELTKLVKESPADE